MRWHDSSMISYKNGLGLSLTNKFRDCSLVERRAHWCRLLPNSSLVLHNSSLVYACSSIVIREASISSIKQSCRGSCSARASTRSLSYSALASSWILSWILSCSRLCSSFASWRAFMVSMSWCKTGALLPSYPYWPCLVFLITSGGSITNVDEIKFYWAPCWAPNVLFGWPQLDWIESSTSGLSPLGALEQRSTGTEGALPIDHTLTIKSMRAYKISI